MADKPKCANCGAELSWREIYWCFTCERTRKDKENFREKVNNIDES